jgi:membrane protein YqaA with SNARE-associated domain
MQYFRQFFDWVMVKAHSPYGVVVLFVAAFFESVFSVFPFMLLFIPLIIANLDRAMYYGKVAALGGILGAVVGYFIGYFAWVDAHGSYTVIAHFFFNNIPHFSVGEYHKIQLLYDQWGALLVFTGGFAPIPFELVTISSGVFEVNFFYFILAVIVGRGGRYLLIAFLIWKFGAGVKVFIEKYFNWIAIGVAASIVIAVVLFRLTV